MKDGYEAQRERWRAQAAAIERSRPARPWMTHTHGGIPVEQGYGPEDAPIGEEEVLTRLGLPGSPPFTRSVYPTGFRNVTWQTQQVVGFGTAEETRERLEYLLQAGLSGFHGSVLNVVFDQPTLNGYDSDDPAASGQVGRGGVAVDSIKDMRDLIEPFDPRQTSLSLVATGMSPILVAYYAEACRTGGVLLKDLVGVSLNDPLTAYYGAQTYLFPPRPSLRLATDLVEYCTAEMPRWNTLGICGYHAREAGATAAMELGFTIACGIAYIEAARDRGLDPNVFAARLSFFLEVNNDFFEEVAKLRAFRRVWATELQHRFGITEPKALAMRCHVQTAGSSCTAQEPENNIVRTTVQALAAVLGGTNSLHTNSMDEALSIPSEKGARIALRTQQILDLESGVGRVADPLGGSYFVEGLTDAVEREGRQFLEAVEAFGPTMQEAVFAALDAGYFHRVIREQSWEDHMAFESGERPVVAVNVFRSDEVPDIELFEDDPALEQKQLGRLHAWREARDPSAVSASLADIRRVAVSGENLFPHFMSAASAGVTVGEIVTELRSHWGSYAQPPPFAG